MTRNFGFLCSMAALASLVGCGTMTSSLPSLTEREGANPPKLVASGQKDSQGREVLTWERQESFARVSPNLKGVGDISCMRARGDLEAIGYHSKALGLDGKPISGGAFLCWTKANGFAQDAVAPRLVRDGANLAWDRPAAFGAVPDSARSRGERICSSLGSFSPIGFHSKARDLNGAEITGGGFLCAPR